MERLPSAASFGKAAPKAEVRQCLMTCFFFFCKKTMKYVKYTSHAGSSKLTSTKYSSALKEHMTITIAKDCSKLCSNLTPSKTSSSHHSNRVSLTSQVRIQNSLLDLFLTRKDFRQREEVAEKSLSTELM